MPNDDKMTYRIPLPEQPFAWCPVVFIGDRVGVDIDGVIHTDVLTSYSYHGGAPAVYPTLTRWQQLSRQLTPRRWRKPLTPIRPATLPTIDFTLGEDVPDSAVNVIINPLGE
jgi:hypothetical protein